MEDIIVSQTVSPAVSKKKEDRAFWVKIIFGILLLIFFVILIANYRRINHVLHRAEWQLLPLAMLFAFISFSFASFSFYFMGRTLKLGISHLRLLLTSFITVTINSLVTAGGSIGYSVRVLLLRNSSNNTRQILAASFFHSYFNLIVPALLLPVGLVILAFSGKASLFLEIILLICTFILLVLFVLGSFVFFNYSWRHKILKLLAIIIRKITGRDLSSTFHGFNEVMDKSSEVLKSKKVIAALLITSLFDWLFCLLTLWVCCRALNLRLPFHLVFAGFFIGIALGFVSLIPGGLGIQEGSTAGIYALLGARFEVAVFVSVLFRLIYYIVPFATGMVLYAVMIKKIGKTSNNN